jgi:CheY-like chemotaxis protein
MRVLIVEDEFLLRDDLARILRAAGHEAVEASNGRRALERMRSDRPDLVLLDLAMPVMSGEDFRAQQLQDPVLAPIPVIIVSGHVDEDQVRALQAAGYVAKPVEEAALLAVVQRFAVKPSDSGKV